MDQRVSFGLGIILLSLFFSFILIPSLNSFAVMEPEQRYLPGAVYGMTSVGIVAVLLALGLLNSKEKSKLGSALDDLRGLEEFAKKYDMEAIAHYSEKSIKSLYELLKDSAAFPSALGQAYRDMAMISKFYHPEKSRQDAANSVFKGDHKTESLKKMLLTTLRDNTDNVTFKRKFRNYFAKVEEDLHELGKMLDKYNVKVDLSDLQPEVLEKYRKDTSNSSEESR